MDHGASEQIIEELRNKKTGKWNNPLHIATNTFRAGVIAKLSRDSQLSEDYSIALLEVYLDSELPTIHEFHGVLNVDELGLWFYDGDGHIDEEIWRQYLLPWKHITGLILHQTS